MQAASNPMTFPQFLELLPMAFGEQNDVPFEPDTLRAIDELGRAAYVMKGGFAIAINKGIPEDRCIVRLRAKIAALDWSTLDKAARVAMLSYLQYGISTHTLSIRRWTSENTVILERQVSLFDLASPGVEREIANFCKNCFCALTMLEHIACPTGGYDAVPRVLQEAQYTNFRKLPRWAHLSAIPSSRPYKRSLPKPEHFPDTVYPTILGIRLFTGVNFPKDPIQVFPPSARSHKLSHLAAVKDTNETVEHITNWRALQSSAAYFFGETPENVSHGQLFYGVEKNRGFWHQMPNGIDLYFKANQCNDGDGDVSISARIKTLVMNPAGLAKMTHYINAYNGSPYVGALSLDVDSTVTLWRAINLQSSKPGEVQRSLKEFALAISDIDDKVTSMTNYVEIPYCAFVGVSTLSKPNSINKSNEPSFKESLWAALQSFGKDGKFAGFDHDAIQSVDIRSLDAATVRDIFLERITHLKPYGAASRGANAARIPSLIANHTTQPVAEDDKPQTVTERHDDYETI